MALAKLKAFVDSSAPVAIRGTDAQDVKREDPRPPWRRHLRLYVAALAVLLALAALISVFATWAAAEPKVRAARLRVATVEQGEFVRDVVAQGTVTAAVSPTLFAIAEGTVSYAVRAGDAVEKGQVLASIDSPALRNEYEKEQATLDAMDAALARQEIEIRRQILSSQQKADLADVTIQAAERELKRSEEAWAQRVISERDYQRARDDLATAKLEFAHARQTAELERDSLALELRARRRDRDRQRLVVENLKRRVEALTVRSPVSGMVANLAQAEKATLQENAPLLTVVDLTAFEIEFQVAETYAREIKPGMLAEITLDGRTHAGEVTAISPEVREGEVTGRVRFTGTQSGGLRQNQRATVRIVLDQRPSVVKFERGPFIDQASRAVYVVRGDYAVRTEVTLGSGSVSEVEVVRGLAPGDRVIVSDLREFGNVPRLRIID